jgi:hypothetical protein
MRIREKPRELSVPWFANVKSTVAHLTPDTGVTIRCIIPIDQWRFVFIVGRRERERERERESKKKKKTRRLKRTNGITFAVRSL